MAKHFEGAIWSFRWPLESRPNGLVRTHTKKTLGIALNGVEAFQGDKEQGVIVIDRHTARLLARRILDCLDKTK